MKNLYPLIVLALLSACSTVSKYHSKVEKSDVPVVPYACQYANKIVRDSVVEITSKDVKKCLTSGDKLVWIRYWVPYCGENSMEVELARKYADKVTLVWVSILWDHETTKQQMQLVPYPISFIDRSLSKHRAKAANEFTNQLVENKVEGHVGSNAFIKGSKLVHHCYSNGISDSLLARLVNLQ